MKKEPLRKGGGVKKHPRKQVTPPEKVQKPKKTEGKKGFPNLAGLSILILLGIVIYSNSFECSFHFDDFYTIVDNPKIRSLSDLGTLWDSSPNRPVAFLTYALNYHFSGYEIRYWHLVNLVIHLGNAILVWWVTLLIFSTPVIKDMQIAGHKKLLAFFTALLFVSHPLATQSVTYIVQRMTSLVAMFYFLSIALYMAGRLSERGSVFKVLMFSGSLISALLAMRTKENAFTLPVTILLVEFFFFRTKKLSVNFRDYRVILLMVLLAGIMLIIPLNYSLSIFKPIIPAGHPEAVLTPYYYLLTQFSAIVKYIQLLFIPVNQNLGYDFPVSTSFFQVRTLISFLVLASLVILAVFLFKKQRVISFGIFWFFVTLSVESSLIPLNDVIMEHRTYLPSFGFFLVVTVVICILLWEKYRLIGMAVLVIIAGINSYLAHERNKVWKDDLTLWTDVVSKSPNKARAITNLGISYANRGKWEEAVNHYSKALSIDPSFPITLISRGFALRNLGQFGEAIDDYTRAIGIEPGNPIAYCNRGVCFYNLGEKEKAIADFTKAIELDPGFEEAYSDRSAAYLEAGQLHEAMDDIDKAISLHPDYYQAYSNRGVIYEKLDQAEKAIEDYTKAIELNPEFAKGYVNRGGVYGGLGQWEKALADHTRAIGLEPYNGEFYFNRGVSYANLGRRDKAIEDYSRAIELDPQNKLAYYNRGLTYGKQGKFRLAIDDFNNALKIDPEFTSAYNNREIAYRKLAERDGGMGR